MKFTDVVTKKDSNTDWFFVNSTLQTRIDLDFPSSSESEILECKQMEEMGIGVNPYHEEDVNVYIMFLLNSLVDSKFYSENGKFLQKKAYEVYEKSTKMNSNWERAMLFRVNADNLLLRLGLFKSEEDDIGNKNYLMSHGMNFYDEARTNYHLGGKSHGLLEVMDKLSADFHKFTIITGDIGMRFGLV
tara:strand:+ start:144 stop:707 length:564 start_codon:yes stop_codon:yes gene_type:complete